MTIEQHPTTGTTITFTADELEAIRSTIDVCKKSTEDYLEEEQEITDSEREIAKAEIEIYTRLLEKVTHQTTTFDDNELLAIRKAIKDEHEAEAVLLQLMIGNGLFLTEELAEITRKHIELNNRLLEQIPDGTNTTHP